MHSAIQTERTVFMRYAQAMIHSLGEIRDVLILEHRDNNNCVAEYNGFRCTAVYNLYTGLYYVDDLYGRL